MKYGGKCSLIFQRDVYLRIHMIPDPKTEMISRIRSALGRDTALREAPVPPEIDEPVARLVYSDIGLPELFQKRARDNSLQVEQVRIDDLLPSIVAFLREQKC